jgi:tetratricopeptide (TPR) repeat protein
MPTIGVRMPSPSWRWILLAVSGSACIFALYWLYSAWQTNQSYNNAIYASLAGLASLIGFIVNRPHDGGLSNSAPKQETATSSTHMPLGSARKNIPYPRNTNFTGRESLLNSLRNALTSVGTTALTQTQTVTGLGGVGKTQLALEYTYSHINDYEVIWWVRSEEPTILANDYIELADRLGLEKGSGKTEELIDAVKQWFENNTGWLLIFDNAQNPRDLTRYLPKIGSGHVIVTSRNQNWESLAKPLEVLVFERPESVKFLLRRTGQRDEKAAEALADALGDLPLALEQAGAYVKETGISFEDYLKRFQEERNEILRYGKPDTYPETIATTWELSVKAASKETPESLDLLNLCAYLSPDMIPRPMLVKGSEHLPDPLASIVKNDVKMDQALASLRRYSLIAFSGDGFFIHRMVQAATQDRMGEEDRKKWAEAAVRLIDDTFPKDHLDNPQSWASCSLLLPHALAAAGHSEGLGVGLEATSRLLNEVGLYLRTRGEFDEAKTALQRALKIDEQVYGPDHPNVARDVNNLGLVLRDLGDLQEARKCFERALKIDEQVYGPDHPQVAIYVNNLGSVLRDLGDLQEARKCYERALKIDEQVYGPDHPQVAIYVNNLGNVLRDLGDLQEARKCYERALKIDEQVYGPDHPTVAIYVNNLGGVLQDLGDLKEARKCLERALKIDEQVYGPDHPNVARDVNNLGNVLRDLGELKEARKCFERALKIFREKLGEDHPNTKIVADNLNSISRD